MPGNPLRVRWLAFIGLELEAGEASTETISFEYLPGYSLGLQRALGASLLSQIEAIGRR
jgi:hypothetical protein